MLEMAARKRLARSTRAQRQYRAKAAGAKAGTGARFRALTSALKKRGGVRTPKALAAWIGRKKYGKAGMARMAAAGRRRKR